MRSSPRKLLVLTGCRENSGAKSFFQTPLQKKKKENTKTRNYSSPKAIIPFKTRFVFPQCYGAKIAGILATQEILNSSAYNLKGSI